MDLASFHTLRTAMQHNAVPAGELPAATLQRGLTDALSASRLFDRVELGRTDDPDQLVIGLCRCADGVMPWEAGVGMERIWRHASAALSWESHSLACTDRLMEFEAAATVDGSGHYLTVHLLAEPPGGWTPPQAEPDRGVLSAPAPKAGVDQR
ncbi:hypothetical protein [Pedococcus sp.]|jgi:hypothetical protein|uniref:hypothetical protein n=1 Tax=Pedococcus sp. TaxID=2860345 RepID=UPI002E14C667|nr:hypothetical protein [Pedococcus sp.]